MGCSLSVSTLFKPIINGFQMLRCLKKRLDEIKYSIQSEFLSIEKEAKRNKFPICAEKKFIMNIQNYFFHGFLTLYTENLISF